METGRGFQMKRHKKHSKKRGFSLIELLIVVAIILIIAAIAIPNLLRSRIAANEASAVGSLRTLNTAEITYNITYPGNGFACSLSVLGPPSGTTSASSTNAGLIDSNLSGGVKSGYSFAVLSSNCAPANGINTTYDIGASPVSPGVTGQRYFCTDSSGVIQYKAAATFTDSTGVCSTGTAL
jgi:type IV pilus assembly protein PilA